MLQVASGHTAVEIHVDNVLFDGLAGVVSGGDVIVNQTLAKVSDVLIFVEGLRLRGEEAIDY